MRVRTDQVVKFWRRTPPRIFFTTTRACASKWVFVCVLSVFMFVTICFFCFSKMTSALNCDLLRQSMAFPHITLFH